MAAVVGATKRYRAGAGDVVALAGVDLTVAPGELVAVVGPSGSGKSTLMHLLGGLDRADAGAVRVAGHDLGSLPDGALSELRRRTIGFVFQSFNLLPGLDARENVAMPALLGGARWHDALDRAEQLLDQVGLHRRSRHLPSQLSGGEAQRVAVARALVCDPVLVLADEPTGNLDSRQGHAILDLLLESRGRRRSVVVVTHDDRLALRADRVVRIADGRVVDSDMAAAGGGAVVGGGAVAADGRVVASDMAAAGGGAVAGGAAARSAPSPSPSPMERSAVGGGAGAQ